MIFIVFAKYGKNVSLHSQSFRNDSKSKCLGNVNKNSSKKSHLDYLFCSNIGQRISQCISQLMVFANVIFPDYFHLCGCDSVAFGPVIVYPWRLHPLYNRRVGRPWSSATQPARSTSSEPTTRT